MEPSHICKAVQVTQCALKRENVDHENVLKPVKFDSTVL
jgi:hypothetical protein